MSASVRRKWTKWGIYTYSAWASALLVQTVMGNAKASARGTGNRYRFSRSFCIMYQQLVCRTDGVPSRTFIIYAYICIAMSAVIKTSHRAYGDTKDRTHSTVMIQPGRLNIYTDKDKAERLRGIIEAVETHSQGNKLLLIGWQQSELYYATQTRPFLGHVQTVIYTGERLKWRLNKRHRHFGLSPIILLRKEDEGEQTYSIIKEWMSRKDYKQVYDDGYVQMYVSHTK